MLGLLLESVKKCHFDDAIVIVMSLPVFMKVPAGHIYCILFLYIVCTQWSLPSAAVTAPMCNVKGSNPAHVGVLQYKKIHL